MNEIQPIKQEITKFVFENEGIQIRNKHEYTNAGDVLKRIKVRLKDLAEQRLSYTRPLDESKKRIMEDFKEATAPLEDLESSIKSIMLSWAREEQKRLDIEQARIDAEALKKAQDEKLSEVTVPVVNTQVKTQRGDFSTNTVVKRWTWEVEDEQLILRQYLVIDKSKITEAVRRGVREIPGVKIYQREDLRVS